MHDVPAEAAQLGFTAPVHALITGRPGERDRRIQLVTAPRFGIVGQQQTIVLRVEDQGTTPGPVQLTIRRDGELLETRNVRAGDPVRVQVQIPHAGQNIVEIEASPLENELTTINNRAVVAIDGVRDKLRVLLVSGEPHAGERTWRNLLKSDASVDLVHFTILRPPEKQDGTPINELSLIAFPTRELFQQKINEFHLIIFDRYARQGVLPMIYFDNIARYVRDGGAVLVAAGPDYASPTSIWRTPLDVVLPAEPSGRTTEVPVPRAAHRSRQAPSGDARARRRATAIRRTGAAGSAWSMRAPNKGTPVMQGPDNKPLLLLSREGEGPRRAAALRSHLAVGARLRGRRAASRSAAPALALADEAARPRGGGAAPWRARASDLEVRRQTHGRRSRAGDRDDADRADAHADPRQGRARRVEGGDAGERTGPVARDRRQAHRAGQCRPGEPARIRRGDVDDERARAARRTRPAATRAASPTRPAISRSRASSAVRSTDTYKGDDWLGLKMRDASVVRGIGVLPLFAGLLGLLLLIGSLAATWMREGR